MGNVVAVDQHSHLKDVRASPLNGCKRTNQSYVIGISGNARSQLKKLTLFPSPDGTTPLLLPLLSFVLFLPFSTCFFPLFTTSNILGIGTGLGLLDNYILLRPRPHHGTTWFGVIGSSDGFSGIRFDGRLLRGHASRKITKTLLLDLLSNQCGLRKLEGSLKSSFSSLAWLRNQNRYVLYQDTLTTTKSIWKRGHDLHNPLTRSFKIT